MKKSALIIGNGDYENAGRLKNPTNDSRDIKRALESIGFSTTYGENLSRKKFKNIAHDFHSVSRDSEIVLFYFSGHGMQYKGDTFVLPIDAEINFEHDIIDEAISLTYVQNVLNDATMDAKLSIFILDSCRSDNVSKSISKTSKTAFSFDKAIVNPPINTEDKQSIIAYATREGTVAYDDAMGDNNFVFCN